MIPLQDNIPSRTTPVVNYALIATCAVVFLAQRADLRDGQARLVEGFAMIPYRVFHPEEDVTIVTRVPIQTRRGVEIAEQERPLPKPSVPAVLTLATCIFLHGGWMHFLGNMWFLYIFGDNVEDRFGHAGYLAFYVLSGVLASCAHLFSAAESFVPTLGASGAIAGVMGAYLVLYPHGRVMSLIPIGFLLQMVVLPAPVFLGVWFILQLFSGTFSLGSTTAAGVAWWAHVGGFVVGAGIAWVVTATGWARPKVEVVRPETDRVRVFRVGPRNGRGF